MAPIGIGMALLPLLLVGGAIVVMIALAASGRRTCGARPRRKDEEIHGATPRAGGGDGVREERGRVLDMVASGAVSAAEGERLLDALGEGGDTLRCPYCAETVPAAEVCAECGTRLDAAGPGRAPRERSFRTLSGLSKFLIIYEIIVCGIVLLSFGWLRNPLVLSGTLLAVLGLASALLMCKGNRIGWALGIAWACAQAVEIIMQNTILNRQVLTVGFRFAQNGAGLGVNVVGIVLLVMFVLAAREWRE